MNSISPTYSLSVSGGLGCRLAAADVDSAAVIVQMAQIMQLAPAGPGDAAFCYLVEASWALLLLLLAGGALLLHGALVAAPLGQGGEMTGVLLAAPGGTGKSTAARRLPPPWQALSDDAALLVPVGERWLAHPWPTWSCFLPGAASSKGGAGGSWAVQQAVPLQAIYFLHRADGEWIEPFGRAQAATRLNESAGQISAGIWKWKPQEQKRALRRACFERSLDLAQSVPCAGLHISLQGAFWEALEADLCAREGAPPACAGLSGCAG